jgi:hypothetical protein
MFPEEADIFLLKALYPMMFRLILNVPDCVSHVRRTENAMNVERKKCIGHRSSTVPPDGMVLLRLIVT